MATSLGSPGLDNVILYEDSIRDNFGDFKIQEFQSAAEKLEQPLSQLKNAGIEVHVKAIQKRIDFELKDNKGQVISNGFCEDNLNRSSYTILGCAITRAFYILNKKISHTIDLLKS